MTWIGGAVKPNFGNARILKAHGIAQRRFGQVTEIDKCWSSIMIIGFGLDHNDDHDHCKSNGLCPD